MAAPRTYEYTVAGPSGKNVKGRLEAVNEAAVAARLREMGVAPLDVREVANSGLNREITLPGFGSKITLKDLAVMARQLAVMILAGLSLLRALTILAEQTESEALRKVLGSVRADVETGSSLSDSFGRHPQVFPPIMLNMIRAGEVGGFLDTTLVRIAENFEAEVKLKAKIKSAMTYPVVVLVIAVVAVVAMLLFIVPIFDEMFTSLGGELPLPTQILVVLSNWMKIGGIPLAILVGVGLWWWNRHKHDLALREKVDPLKLKAPIFGKLFQKVAVARFTRNLGIMLHSGVPILQALDIVGDTSGNIVISHALKDVQASVREGRALAEPLKNHPVFPPMVVQMISVGEDTGALDEMLIRVADFYDQEVEATTDQLTSIIEPIMIAFLGGIVGSMIVALYMPIFSIFELIE